VILYRPPCPVVFIENSDDSKSFCTGSTVTLLSNIYYPGINPTHYQWYRNGSPLVGQTGDTLSYSNFSNLDTCYLCITGSSCNGSTSNTITISITQKRTPTITIARQGFELSFICDGEEVLITSTTASGGTLPTFDWKYFEVEYGQWMSLGYTGSTMKFVPYDGIQIRCYMTSNEWCIITGVTISNTLTLTVTPIPIPSVYITPTGTTCSGVTVTYSAIPTNGGSGPSYVWYVNDVEQLSTNSAFTYKPSNGDVITVSMVSNAVCANRGVSYSFIQNVTPNQTFTIPILSVPGNYLYQP